MTNERPDAVAIDANGYWWRVWQGDDHWSMTIRVVHVTEAELALAFTEWDRRFREEPDRFESEAFRLLKGTPESYGESCAPYLVGLLDGTV